MQRLRPKFVFLFSIVLAVASFVLSFEASAQTHCPRRDCLFPVAAQGLSDAVQTFEGRQPAGFQHAMIVRKGPKPTYVTDEAGRITCAFGCDEKGETGETPKAKLYQIEVMGNDSRENSDSFLNSNDEQKYSNTGRMECNTPSGRRQGGTGWIAGSAQTFVTVAHAFVDEETGQPIGVNNCKFVLYDGNGNKLDSIGLVKLKSRWQDPSHPERKNDSSHDIAIIKLERAPVIKISAPDIVDGHGQSNRNVRIIGFHGDVSNNHVKRKPYGKLYPFPIGARGLLTKASDTKSLFIASYDSNGVSSGSMIIDEKTDSIIGMHIGTGKIPGKKSGDEFDPNAHFNYGVLFDDEFYRDLNAMKSN